jgi:cystathionine beta-lyase
MTSRFDTVIERRGTGSLKWDAAASRGLPADALPMWVADMDFAVPDAVTDALMSRVTHGIYGYSEPDDAYFEAVLGWLGQRHGLNVEREWIVPTPGVVYALAQAVCAFTTPGDAVIIQQPVYYPFSEVVVDNGRRLVVNELVLDEEAGRYRMDLEAFEEAVVSEGVRMFMLCNPHNPVGAVWAADDLRALGEICLRHGVTVIADEIHQDLILRGRHVPFISLDPRFAGLTVTCTAPSKTFNLAGLQVANLIIPSPGLRETFKQQVTSSGYSQLNPLGLVAGTAAYTHGAAWLEELLEYLRGNVAFMRDYLAEHIPDVRLIEPDGTYLAWLDLRRLGLTEQAKRELVVERARLWLDAGTMFGAGGEGFERINLACPRSTLASALDRLAAATTH